MSIKTIFLDRDGVINREINYLHKIDDFEFIDGIFETCHQLISLGYKIIVITNQSGIARGYYSNDDFKTITKWMIEQFKNNNINILDVFHCPHSPDQNCICRKPKPGMLMKAKLKHNINMKNSWLIGDKEVDILAANSAGVSNTILVRSGHKINEDNSNAKYILDTIYQARQVITN